MRTYNIARTAVLALLTSALAATPVQALASGVQDAPAQDALVTSEVGAEEDVNYNAEYVASLRGLTDAERAELLSLMDARDACWEAGVDPDAATVMRISELQHIDLVTCAADTLSAAEVEELKSLLATFDALPGTSYMDHASWDRLKELEYKSYDPDCELTTNASQAAELTGVTEAERKEYAELGYQIDQDIERGFTIDEGVWARRDAIVEKDTQAKMKARLGAERYAEYEALVARLDSLGRGLYLSAEDYMRLEELENIAYGIEDPSTIAQNVSELKGLEAPEKEELIDLLYKSDQDYRRGFDEESPVSERIAELYRKNELRVAQVCLSAGEFSEYQALEARAYAQEELTDAEWERYFELSDRIYAAY